MSEFGEAVTAAMREGQSAHRAILAAAAAHLGATQQHNERLARVAVALARDFERAEGVAVRGNAMAMIRIAEATHRVLAGDASELNLPFLAATTDGPKHLQRTLSPGELDELARRDPDAPDPDPAPAPKKRGWFN